MKYKSISDEELKRKLKSGEIRLVSEEEHDRIKQLKEEGLTQHQAFDKVMGRTLKEYYKKKLN